MSRRESDESRKNNAYDIWLNPKYFYNGQSATKPRIGEGSTTMDVKSSRTQVIGVRNCALTIQSDCDEDIVYARAERPRGVNPAQE